MRILLYNSDSFFVIESPAWGGIEVVDKRYRRGAFFEGELAASVRSSMADLAARRSGEQAMDSFLRQYAWLYNTPLSLH